MRVRFAGIELRNPVIAASGTFGYGVEFEDIVALDRIGGLVTKGLSREPMDGNPAPRLIETASGMLNSIGLQNIGVQAFIEKKLPALAKYPGCAVIANVFGYEVHDYVAVIEALNKAEGIAAYEINASCPNTKHGGQVFGTDMVALATLVYAAKQAANKVSPAAVFPANLSAEMSSRPEHINDLSSRPEQSQDLSSRPGQINDLSFRPEHTKDLSSRPESAAADGVERPAFPAVPSATHRPIPRPVIVKLSPNVTSIAEMALVAEQAGADALSLVNTFAAMAIDAKTRRPRIANITAGLSGPAIKPIALRMVYEAAKAVKIPIIGLGGIVTPEDAIEFLLAGATAIQVGTASYADPRATERLARGLEQWCAKHNVEKVANLVGALET